MDDGLVAHLLELLTPLGPVRARRMFGGVGFFLDQRMFGLIADDVFYLKADAANRPMFEEAGCRPFVYPLRGVPKKSMSYFEPPESTLDNAEALRPWAVGALEAAARAAQKLPRKPRPPKRRKTTR